MNTRMTRKKQVVAAFDTSKEHVAISLADFAWISAILEPDTLAIASFIAELSSSQDLQAQIRVIQAKKGQFKQVFAAPAEHPAVSLSAAAKALVQLYLRPNFFALRGSLEWIIETLARAEGTPVVASAVKEACVAEWQALASRSTDATIDVNELIGVALSMNCMAGLDSHFGWLTNGSVTDECVAFVDGTALQQFTEGLASMYTRCADKINPADAELRVPSAELLKYVECCGESMRVLMAVLKRHRAGYVPAIGDAGAPSSAAWRQICEQLVSSSARVLVSEHANKDVITFTALCLVNIQWLLRRPDDNSCTHTSATQLSAIVALVSSTDDTTNASHSDTVSVMHPLVAEAAQKSSLMAKCAVMRACLAVYDDLHLLHQSATSETLLVGPMFTFIMRVCGHDLPTNRLYGFQTLESWLARLLTIPAELLFGTAAVGSAQFAHITDNFLAVTSALTKAWSHPSRQVNHLVPNIYTKTVHAINALQTSFATVQSGAYVACTSALWATLLREALSMPAHHRGRYQALNNLLPYMGAARILQSQPDIVHLLVNAVGTRDIASAASGFLASLLVELYFAAGATVSAPTDAPVSAAQQEALAAVRSQWTAAVIGALCHPTSRKLRVHVADYLLPELLRADASCVPHLIVSIRNMSETAVSAAGTVTATLHSKLWGIVNLTQLARLKGLPGQSTSATGAAGITEEELLLACISADNELRLVALTALVASSRTAAPMEATDMRVLRQTLRYSLKNSDADHRHKIVRVVKALFLRLKESCRVSERDLVKLEKQMQFAEEAGRVEASVPTPATTASGEGAAVSKDKKHKSRKLQQQQQSAMSVADCVVAMDTSKRVIQDSFDACEWLSAELLDNLYPGASSDREVMSLDLLAALIDAMGADSPQMKRVYSAHMVRTLINLFISSWDRSRRMAADLLLQLPRPLTGYLTHDEAAALLQWGLELAGSAKLRESDAGALLVRDMFVIYSADLKWDLSATITGSVAQVDPVSAALSVFQGCEEFACGTFISSLCDRWNAALVRLEEVFTSFNMSEILSSSQQYPYQASGSSAVVPLPTFTTEDASAPTFPLCHGILLAIRFCLTETQKAGMLDGNVRNRGSTRAQFWQPVIRRIYQYALKSLRLAMTIVAEAPSDVPFAPVPISSKGPVNAASAPGANKSMAASYINTNSSMGTGAAKNKTAKTGDDDIDSDEASGGATAQRAVVAAWLLVKESASLLSLLVSISPPIAIVAVGADRDPQELLCDSEVVEAGGVILDALGRLKHMGAISEAQVALQSIATTLLRHGSKSPTLCRLPRQWLDQVLGRLQGEQQQVFILRRSAGFAYSFLSLLKAEPLNCTPTLLPVAMQSLLQTVRLGLDDAQNYVDATDDDGDFTSKWKLAVHALNVLRLILSDAALGPDLNIYIPETAQLAVRGFTAPQWSVRNSCMMVFTAVAQRAVGTDKNDSAGAAVPTIAEFFQRFPALEPFLVSELSIATAGKDGAGAVYPTLYPLLLLIAKLRVTVTPENTSTGSADDNSDDAAGAATVTTQHALVQLVKSCCSQRVQAVRVIAAKALRVLIPVSASPAAAAALLDALSVKIALGRRLDLNAVHGEVLSVRELTKSAAAYVETNAFSNEELVSALRTETAAELVHRLQTAADVLSSVRCAPIHLALLEAIQNARKTFGAVDDVADSPINHLLLQQCRSVLPWIAHTNNTATAQFVLPYEPWLWRESAQALVQFSMDARKAGVSACIANQCVPLEVVFDLLNHHISEVREGVLKGLLAHLDGSKGTSPLLSELKGDFLQQLLTRAKAEDQPPIAQWTLQLFVRLIEHAPLSSLSCEIRALFRTEGFNTLDTLLGATVSATAGAPLTLKQNSSAQAALEIQGWIVEDLAGTCEAADFLGRWAKALEAASPEGQSVALRLSAARSIQHSCLLAPIAPTAVPAVAASATSTVQLRAILCALTLLQDDDEDVRDVVNALLIGACSAVQHNALLAVKVPAGYATTEEFSLQALSATITRLLEDSQQESSSSNQRFDLVWKALKLSIQGGGGNICDLLCTDNAAMSQKIFEAEQDNLYVEPICAGRVLISALTRAVKTVLSGPNAAPLTAWLNTSVVPSCVDAVGHFQVSTEAQSYQPLLFQYFYLSFLLGRTMNAVTVASEAFETCRVSGGAGECRDKTHPWILTEFARK